MACEILHPLKFLTSDVRILLILLNQSVVKDNILKKLWSNSVLKVCCDGAANQLHDFNVRNNTEKCERLVPNFICGDLDSAREEVLDDFKIENTEVVHLEDQDATDFTKATLFALEHCKKKNIDYDVIVSFPALGGRIDQTLSNINTLYIIERVQNKPCYLVSDIDVVCLLKPGKSKIIIDLHLKGEWCGLVPIGCEAMHVTTSGLKYNLNNNNMLFGGLISTSNSIAEGSNEVDVDTSHYILWMLGYLADHV